AVHAVGLPDARVGASVAVEVPEAERGVDRAGREARGRDRRQWRAEPLAGREVARDAADRQRARVRPSVGVDVGARGEVVARCLVGLIELADVVVVDGPITIVVLAVADLGRRADGAGARPPHAGVARLDARLALPDVGAAGPRRARARRRGERLELP